MMAASRITKGLGSGACQDSSRNAACSCEAAVRCLAKQHQEHQLGEPGSFQGLEMPNNATHSFSSYQLSLNSFFCAGKGLVDRHQELLDAALRKDDAEQRPEHRTCGHHMKAQAPARPSAHVQVLFPM